MVVLKPNVVRGGQAIGLGNNLYLMKGRTHSKGGIDIGKNPKTGLEVENNEVMQVSPQGVRVFSAQPILGGISPAQYILGGANPNQVFNAQEQWKRVNRINDDGTKKAQLGKELYKKKHNVSLIDDIPEPEAPLNYDEIKRRQEFMESEFNSKAYMGWINSLPKETRDYVNFSLRNQDINNAKNNERYNSLIKKYGGRKIAQDGINAPRDNTRVKFNDTTRTLDKEELNKLSERNKNIRLDDGLLGFTPIVGDVLQGAQGIQDIKDKKYKSGLISLGLLALPNAIEKPLKYAKNFYKSRKYLKSSEKYIRKLYETEPNVTKIEDIESNLLYNGASGNKGDIISLGYFDDYDLDLRNIRRKGSIIVAKNPNNTIYIDNAISKEDAINTFNDLVKNQNRTKTFDFMKKAKEDYEWLKSGRKVSLINDESLSIDSYPLLEAFAERKARGGFGEIKPVIDANGSYRMIKLNRYGKYRSKKDLDKAIDRLREHTGDKNIPGRIGIGNGLNYVPAFEFYKYKYGGIHIKPSKRGTFTAAAKKHGMSVQGFASKVLANKGKYSSAMVKKANFARNASKWKHKEFGGDMDFNYWITKDNIYKLGGRKKGQWGLQDYSNSFKINLDPSVVIAPTNKTSISGMSLGIPNLIGAGLNLAGNVASYFVNRRALKSMQPPVAPSAPTPLRAENLETRVSTAAQEAALRENIAKQENLIAGNLSSSRSRLNSVNAVRNQGIGLYNQLQERKQNIQTELINRAKLNRQQINSQNTLLANQYKDNVTNWRNSVIDFENKRRDALSENAIQHLIQGPIDAIAGERGYFANLENNKRYRISAFLNAIGNPNAVGTIKSGEFLPLARQFGLTENNLKRLGLM